MLNWSERENCLHHWSYDSLFILFSRIVWRLKGHRFLKILAIYIACYKYLVEASFWCFILHFTTFVTNLISLIKVYSTAVINNLKNCSFVAFTIKTINIAASQFRTIKFISCLLLFCSAEICMLFVLLITRIDAAANTTQFSANFSIHIEVINIKIVKYLEIIW